MTDHAARRQRMVRRDLAGRDITDERVLAAMAAVPREEFVGPLHRRAAYDDRPLPIGEGQTISQPYVVAFMLQAIEPAAGDRLLEIGTGSGYGAAVASQLVEEVHTVERHGELAERARGVLEGLGYETVHVHVGDGTQGWPEAAPYDEIVVTAAGSEVPEPLLAQLRPGGRLVMPVAAGRGHQRLLLLRSDPEGREPATVDLGAVAFVPLVGEH